MESERESNVFVLRFTSDRTVKSEKLDLQDKAGTAEQVLREVPDVDVTMPLWAERALEGAIARYLSRKLTPETARALRNELREAGLARWIPDALSRIANANVDE